MITKIEGLQLDNMKKAPIGFSGDAVFLLPKGYQGNDVVVKISKRKEVLYEAENFKWLASKIRVPKIYQTGVIEGNYYCVMELLPGKMFQETFTKETIKENIMLYAKAIRNFHDLSTEGLPYNHTIEDKILAAKQVVQQGEAKTQYFEREFSCMTGKEVYDLMISYQQEEEDMVLCHGDVCMPNFILAENKEVGYIDIVQIGKSDRHLDLAIALRSLRYNLEQIGDTLTMQYIEYFKQAYGIEQLNCDKIMFYILLDELTNG